MPIPPRPLREYRVTLSRATEEQPAIDLEYPDHLGLRTKLGGEPTFIHGGEVPNCSTCGTRLHFVAQIDSIEHNWLTNPHAHQAKEQHFMFGDVGMIYVFYCFTCGQPSCVLESY